MKILTGSNQAYGKFTLVLIYAAIVLVACRYIKKNSYYDYDILVYTASAIQDGSQSPKELQEQTYGLIKKDLGEEKFKRLTDSAHYFRNAVYRSPENFYSQLAFAKSKPLYVSLLSMAYKSGVSPVFFSTYLNLFAYLLIAAILLLYLIRQVDFLRAYVISLCIILLPFVLDTAKNNTPDLLSGALFLSTCLLLLSNKHTNHYLAGALCCVLIFIRPENSIFVVAFCATAYYFKAPLYSKTYLTVLCFLAILCYGFVSLYFDTHSWSTLYKHSFTSLIPDLQHPHPALTLKEYLKGFRFIPITAFHSCFFLILLFLVLAVMNFKPKTNFWIMTVALLLSLLIRILLFPDLSSRYYNGAFLVSVVLFFLSIYKKTIDANA